MRRGGRAAAPGLTCFFQELAGGVATYIGPGSPFNKLAGLGFAGAVDEEHLARVERALADRGTPVQAEVANLADPSVSALLTRRGYVLQNFENVLGMRLPAANLPHLGAGIEVSAADEKHHEAWLDVVVTGFANPDTQGVPSHEDFPREVLERAVGDLATASGFARYLAYRDGVVAGGASQRVCDGFAQLCGAATAPTHRRHGVLERPARGPTDRRRAPEMLVDHGADVNSAERERGQTALMWAAAQQHADVVRLLAARGADLHARTRVWEQLENTAGNTNTSGNFRMQHGGSTALLFAARSGDVATARALVAAGADVDDTAAAGTSALVIAAHSGHGPFGTYLLEQGADPNAGDAGYSALHAAILRGQAGLAEALLGYGADLNTLVERGTPGRRFSADFSIRHQAVGANAFWLAARYGELETLRRLADWGGDPQVSPANRVSSLKAAIGIPQISQEDRRNRVDAPDSVEHVDQEQTTLDLARIVLDLGVDVNQTDDRGNTALHDAVRTGFASLVDLLASHDADLDALNDRGQTPLVLAETSLPVPGTNGLRSTQPEIAARLRELGADD